MKWTTLTFKQLAQQKTLRMDAKYWIKKNKKRSELQAPSRKLQAPRNREQAASSKQQAIRLPQLNDKSRIESYK